MDQTAPLGPILASSRPKGVTLKYEPGVHGPEGGFLKAKAKGVGGEEKAAFLDRVGGGGGMGDGSVETKAASPLREAVPPRGKDASPRR